MKLSFTTIHSKARTAEVKRNLAVASRDEPQTDRDVQLMKQRHDMDHTRKRMTCERFAKAICVAAQ